MKSKKLRRASWPAIENYFRRNNQDQLINKHNKTTTRRYYVDGINPEGWIYDPYTPKIQEFNHFQKLLLEPDASLEDWMQWCDRSSSYMRENNSGIWLLNIQGGKENSIGWGFGDNSLFFGRDEAIYNYFYDIEGRKPQFPIDESDPVATLLTLPSCIKYPMLRMRLNPQYICWRFAESRFREISKLPPERFDGYKDDAIQQELAMSMCAVEWARRHPDRFNSNAQAMVNLSHEFYTNTNKTVKSAYETTLDSKLIDWAEATGAGGTMFIAMQFEKPEHLEAIIPLLHHKTRYPCSEDDEAGVIKALPLLKGRNYRVSYYLIQHYWNCGFSVNRYKRCGDKSLLMELTMPLSRLQLYPVLKYLTVNSIGLADRLKARKNLPGDTLFEDENPPAARLIYLIHPMEGTARAGTVLREEDKLENFHSVWSEMGIGVNSAVDSALESTYDDIDIDKLFDCYKLITVGGKEPMHSEYEYSIDGFERRL